MRGVLCVLVVVVACTSSDTPQKAPRPAAGTYATDWGTCNASATTTFQLVDNADGSVTYCSGSSCPAGLKMHDVGSGEYWGSGSSIVCGYDGECGCTRGQELYEANTAVANPDGSVHISIGTAVDQLTSCGGGPDNALLTWCDFTGTPSP